MALIISIAIGVASFMLSYYIASLISPPYIIVQTRQYGVMPTGQLLIAFFISPFLTLFSFFYFAFKVKKGG
jgi:hypothetical protein